MTLLPTDLNLTSDEFGSQSIEYSTDKDNVGEDGSKIEEELPR